MFFELSTLQSLVALAPAVVDFLLDNMLDEFLPNK